MLAASAQLAARLEQGSTTLCQLLTITRKDGTVYRFSTATTYKTFGGEVYYPGGFDPTDIQNTTSKGIGGFDVTAYFKGGLTVPDVARGKFDLATVSLEIGDWLYPQYGTMQLFSGIIERSSVTNEKAAQFTMASRQILNSRSFGEKRQALCRAQFGDHRCKYPIDDIKRQAIVSAISGRNLTISYEDDLGNPVPEQQSNGSHRLWRVKMFGTNRIINIGLEWKDTSGVLIPVVAGEAVHWYNDPDDFNDENDPMRAYDGTYSWRGKDGATKGYVGAFWPAVKAVGFLDIICGGDKKNAPTSIVVQYSDEVAGSDYRHEESWTDALGFSESGISWTSGETKTFGLGTTALQSSYLGGITQFLAGENAGEMLEIVGYTETAGGAEIVLAIPPSREVVAGEALMIWPGCDKTLARCIYYNNVVNRRAEDYVPTASYSGQNKLIL